MGGHAPISEYVDGGVWGPTTAAWFTESQSRVYRCLCKTFLPSPTLSQRHLPSFNLIQLGILHSYRWLQPKWWKCNENVTILNVRDGFQNNSCPVTRLMSICIICSFLAITVVRVELTMISVSMFFLLLTAFSIGSLPSILYVVLSLHSSLILSRSPLMQAPVAISVFLCTCSLSQFFLFILSIWTTIVNLLLTNLFLELSFTPNSILSSSIPFFCYQLS